MQYLVQSAIIRRRRAPGQSMVEFALTVTIILFVIMGILEISRLVFTVNEMSNAAREGSHYAALHPDLSTPTSITLTQQVRSSLFIVDAATITPTFTCPSCQTCPPNTCFTAIGQPLTVTVQYIWNPLVRLPGLQGITIQQASTTLRER